MKIVGIREARQNISELIAELQRGHEITITDRGRAVARLVPPRAVETKVFRGRAAFRRSISLSGASLLATVLDERAARR